MREGKHYNFRKLEFWAERGMVNIIDYRYEQDDDKFFSVIVVRDFLIRLNHLGEELKQHQHQYADERNEYLNFMEDGCKCAREAKAQGRPDDPKAVAQILRQRRKNFSGAELASNDSYVIACSTGERWRLAGGIPADIAPENKVLPAMPKADPNKPIVTLE